MAKNDRTGSGKAMETLPGSKTAIKKTKIQKMTDKSKIPNFRIFPGEARLFSHGNSLASELASGNSFGIPLQS